VVSVGVSWSWSSEETPLESLPDESVPLVAEDEDAHTAKPATRAASAARRPVSLSARAFVMLTSFHGSLVDSRPSPSSRSDT
jgi:hypothetical protein